MMKKRYDYHSARDYSGILFGLCFGLSCLYLILYFRIPDLSGKMFALCVIIFLIVGSIVAYFSTVNTYIEVTEDGILFSGWKKRIAAKWFDVRKIKKLIPLKGSLRYKIYTTGGTFTIGMVELAETPVLSPIDVFTRDRAKYLNELLDEIKKRAPHALYVINILERPL
jgi:hypothetical protein